MDSNSKVTIELLEEQLKVSRNELANLRQQVRTLKAINEKGYKDITDKLNGWKCSQCQASPNHPSCTNTTNSPLVIPQGSQTSQQSPGSEVTLTPIGVIRTIHQEKRGTPRQPSISAETSAVIQLNNDVFTNPSHSLDGLEEFSHLWILFHFHKNDSTHVRAKISPPRLNGARLGVFATRSPHRPAPIGLSLVKKERIENNCVYFSGVDMIDGTPVLDIKPYIPMYDCPRSSETCETGLLTTGISNISITSNSSASHTSDTTQGASTTRDALNISSFERTSLDGQESDTENQTFSETNTYQTVCDTRVASNTSQMAIGRRPDSRFGEREAPDGEEDENELNPSNTTSTNVTSSSIMAPSGTGGSSVQVPSWITDSPTSQLEVAFSDAALVQLQQVIGDEWIQTKIIVENVLRADPRSSYLRARWSNHTYTFRIASIEISCQFDDVNHAVSVIKIAKTPTTDCTNSRTRA